MISLTASYAVRALTWMAAGPPGAWQLNRRIAEDLALPPQFLTKILGTLTASGILESQRGKAGGFRLARPPKEITLLEVVELFDNPVAHDLCLLGQKFCSDESPCPLHDDWKRISAQLARVMKTRTLADLSNGSGELAYPRPPETRRPGEKRSAATRRPTYDPLESSKENAKKPPGPNRKTDPKADSRTSPKQAARPGSKPGPKRTPRTNPKSSLKARTSS